jgi:hypothetical protein
MLRIVRQTVVMLSMVLLSVFLSVNMLSSIYAECCYGEYHPADCPYNGYHFHVRVSMLRIDLRL